MSERIKNWFIIPCLLVLFICIYLFVIKTTYVFGWDDGAITLAYGQTLGKYGKYALNFASEIVEGSSSNFLVFETALITRIVNLDFFQIILWAQLNTFIFTIGVLVATFFLLKKNIKNDNLFLFIIVFLLGCLPVFFNEVMNGMEMTILSFFLLLFVITFDKKSKWIYCCIPIILLIRFEAFFYILLPLLALFIFNKSNRLWIAKLLIYTIVICSVFTFFRYIYFGEFIPNTVLAKRHYPYSPTSYILMRKINGGINFIKIMNVLLLVPVILFFLNRKSLKNEFNNIKFWLILAFFGGSFVFGANWGYVGRMFMAVIPLAFVYCADLIFDNNNEENIIIKNKYKKKLLLFTILCSMIFNYRSYNSTYHRLLDAKTNTAKLYQGKDDFGITPMTCRKTGLAVDELRDQLHLNIINFMVPDVGGSALSTEKVNIIDIGLLTNKYLAKNGYSYFDTYLQMIKPDLIEVHPMWTDITNIFDNKYFQKNYTPIIFNNHFFWLRNDYIKYIGKSHKLNWISIKKVSPKTKNFFKENYTQKIPTTIVGVIY